MRWSSWLNVGLTVGAIALTPVVQAQVMPDGTLGGEASQGRAIAPNIELIEGGAPRGVNLFHSFREFNVPTGGAVYFANPPAVLNIFSRVTGGNASTIDGTLGVLGSANLFLLNPNGLLFGPYAQLDIKGSFLATTANELTFPDGHEFSATDPRTAPLLTVNLTPGLQLGANSAPLTNQGNLVAGQDLTLAADNLDLQGQMQAGRDLTLQAQDTVKLRDTTTALIATAGRDLTIEGQQGVDILALSQPQTQMQSGRNFNLISDGLISGDANFSSGGTFQVRSVLGQLANFTSLDNSLISSRGDVDLAANYGIGGRAAASLLIESQGNVRIQGKVLIDAPDLISTFVGNDAILASQPGLIIRSGQPNLVYGGINRNALTPTPGPVPAGITLDQPVRVQPNAQGGIVKLTAATGGIKFDSINISDTNGSNGGDIQLTANGDITSTGLRKKGAILESSSSSGNGSSGNGGNIALISVLGNIALISTSENSIESYSFADSGKSGSGGAITLTATNGNLALNQLQLSANSTVGNGGTAGNGGAITLGATNGNLALTNSILDSIASSASGNAGNGGAITLTANNLVLTGVSLDSNSANTGNGGNAGNGGAITLTANNNLALTKSSPNSSSLSTATSGNAGNGGAITLTAINGNLALNQSTLAAISISRSGAARNGGDITLNARAGSILGDSTALNSYTAAAAQQSTGNGGVVTLEVNTKVSGLYFTTIASGGLAGDVKIKGYGNLGVTDTQILIPPNIEEKTCNGCPPIKLNLSDNKRQAGSFLVSSDGDITFSNSPVLSQTGDIQIISPGLITFNQSAIRSDTSSTTAAGSILVNAGQGITIIGAASGLFAKTTNLDNTGNITLNTPQLTLQQNAQIATASSSSGKAGDIFLNAANLTIDSGAQILTTTSGSGAGGTITVNAPTTISLGRQDSSSVIFVETSGAGKAGDIIINTPTLTLSDTARITATATSTATNTEGGGNITLNASRLNLTGIVEVFTETQGNAPAGTLRLNPYRNQSTLDIRLAPQAKIYVPTSDTGRGGDLILIAPEAITIGGPGKLTVETSGSGPAGNIIVQTQNLKLQDGVELLATTAGAGKGGNISITTDQTALTDGAKVAVSGTGSGDSGFLTIQSQTLLLERQALLSATSNSGQGGDINLNIADRLVLRYNSNISTTAGTAQAKGDGGNINFNGKFIIAVPQENSDITANAFTGKGGNVTIKAQGIFGIQRRSRLTPLSDITASSEFGIDGNVTIDVDIDPRRGLVAVPKIGDVSDRIASGCSVGGSAKADEFVITGRGGLPPNPSDPLTPDATFNQYAAVAQARSAPLPDQPAAIVEAQGFVRLPNGRIRFVAQATKVTPSAPWQPGASCIH